MTFPGSNSTVISTSGQRRNCQTLETHGVRTSASRLQGRPRFPRNAASSRAGHGWRCRNPCRRSREGRGNNTERIGGGAATAGIPSNERYRDRTRRRLRLSRERMARPAFVSRHGRRPSGPAHQFRHPQPRSHPERWDASPLTMVGDLAQDFTLMAECRFIRLDIQGTASLPKDSQTTAES